MRTLVGKITLLYLTCILISGATLAGPATRPTLPKETEPIVVVVRKNDKGLLFEVEFDGHEYKKVDANYYLADLKMKRGGDHPVLLLVEDKAPLSAITEASEMAINAGFKDIRPYIYWHKTGNMARIEYGQVIKFTKDPDKIERREGRR
jgi:hypothetical protein